jgi:hypothetical protein
MALKIMDTYILGFTEHLNKHSSQVNLSCSTHSWNQF